jgi:hypothetical protein
LNLKVFVFGFFLFHERKNGRLSASADFFSLSADPEIFLTVLREGEIVWASGKRQGGG